MVTFLSLLSQYVPKIVIAIIVYFVGKWLIDKAAELVKKSKWLAETDPSLHTFTVSFIRIAMYALLIIIIVSIIGIPMASIIAVLASAGVTVGLALQGALANLAGGIMLMVFKPFKVGDYIDAAGGSGVVREITLFYTTLTTLDNKRVTIPNGSLMNSNVTDYSAEPIRRVDLTFNVAKSVDPAKVQALILEATAKTDKVLQDPEPFARVSGGTNDSMEFTARGWCNSADYWDVYFDMTQNIIEALGEAGVPAPVLRVKSEN